MTHTPAEIVCIENALMDVIVRLTDEQLAQLKIHKGSMQLIDTEELMPLLHTVMGFGTKPAQEIGGAGSNVMRGLATLGIKTCYSSAVGDDAMGQAFSKRLEDNDMNNQLRIVQKAHTGTCVICVTPDGERSMHTHLGACRLYEPQYVPLEHIASAKIFFSTGYMLDTPYQMESFWTAVAHAKKHNVKCAFDLGDGFVMDRHGKDYMKDLCKQMDVVFANRTESLALLGLSGLEAATELHKFAPLAIVKDGVNGAFIASSHTTIHVPAATPTAVLDTTGAGDFFASGFLYGLLQKWDYGRCAQLAVKMASSTLPHLGAYISPDVRKFI